MQVRPTYRLTAFPARISFQKLPLLSAFFQLMKSPKPGRKTPPPCLLGVCCSPPSQARQPAAPGCLWAALRAKPTAFHSVPDGS